MPAWSDLLRTLRKERRLLQEEVRARAGISLRTLTAYERGKVRPSRDTLLKLAAALDLNRHATNTLLAGAGFDPVPTGLLSRFARRSIFLAAMQREIDRCSWPCLVMGDDMTVLLWNEPATSVVEMDFAEVLPDPADRMLTRIVALDHFRSRMLNWNEFVAMMVALLKADFESPEQYAAAMPWFARLMQDLSTRPEYRDAFPEIMRLYNSAKPRSDVARTSCPVTWRQSDGTVLRFHGVLTTWDDFAALWAFDWFPADAETASWLQARADERMPRMPETPENRPESSNDVEHLLRWYELLRSAREKSGFTQAGLAQAAGIAEETLFSYEYDRRRPSRSVLLRLAHAMQLDGATTNLLLSGSGHAPAASEFARSVAGLPNSDPRFRPDRWQLVAEQTAHDLQATISSHAWPCLVLDARCQPIAWNEPIQRQLGEPRYDTLLHLLVSPTFREHVLDYDEVVSAIAPSGLKQFVTGTASDARLQPYPAVLAALAEAEPHRTERLRAAWESTPDTALSTRAMVPIVWQADDGSLLQFHGLLTLWSDYLWYWALDFHPADAATWAWLGKR